MSIHKADRPAWGRRDFVRAVLASGSAVALGAVPGNQNIPPEARS
jgi:hypothetical protein